MISQSVLSILFHRHSSRTTADMEPAVENLNYSTNSNSPAESNFSFNNSVEQNAELRQVLTDIFLPSTIIRSKEDDRICEALIDACVSLATFKEYSADMMYRKLLELHEAYQYQHSVSLSQPTTTTDTKEKSTEISGGDTESTNILSSLISSLPKRKVSIKSVGFAGEKEKSGRKKTETFEEARARQMFHKRLSSVTARDFLSSVKVKKSTFPGQHNEFFFEIEKMAQKKKRIPFVPKPSNLLNFYMISKNIKDVELHLEEKKKDIETMETNKILNDVMMHQTKLNVND